MLFEFTADISYEHVKVVEISLLEDFEIRLLPHIYNIIVSAKIAFRIDNCGVTEHVSHEFCAINSKPSLLAVSNACLFTQRYATMACDA